MDTTAHESVKIHSNKSRLAPAFTLFLLSPLIGEFLLGNLSVTWLWVLILLAPLYGGGAILIRETARRWNLGWHGILILCLVYAIIEEALVTQSLFNPNYIGLRLLDYGFIPSLGIGAWWTVFVLAIHVIWSTAVPIALVEAMTAKDRHRPWLSIQWLCGIAVIFISACILLFLEQQYSAPFMASMNQLWVSGGIVLALTIAAFLWGKRKMAVQHSTQNSIGLWHCFIAAFLLGSGFMAHVFLLELLPAVAVVSVMMLLLLISAVLLWNVSNQTGWTERHRFAVAAGVMLTYGWFGLAQPPSVGETSVWIDNCGNAFFTVSAVCLLVYIHKTMVNEQA